MAVKPKYSAAFKEQALSKVLSRGSRTIGAIAEELNLSVFTLKNWMKSKTGRDVQAVGERQRRPQEWSAAEQLLALHESHGLEGEALNAWCRHKGVFAHHLVSWREAFCALGKDDSQAERERRLLKEENQQLKRDLLRKEKALVEAAALLMLQKKYQALWGDEAK
jgi:transposase